MTAYIRYRFHALPCIPAALVALAAAAPLAPAAAQEPATLRSLEQREIEIVPSQATPADLKTIRDNYRELLKLTRDPSERQPILRRLADVELAIAMQSPNPQPGARRALNIYQSLTANRSYRDREADLLYRTAHAADIAGDVAAQIVALTRLIDNYPQFELMQEAHFRRAEVRFVHSNYRLAEEDYSWLVERGPQNKFYLQALYKRGWARFRQGEHQAALEDELKALQSLLGELPKGASSVDLSGLSKAEQVLAEDALRNMTLNFALLGQELTPGQFVAAHNVPSYAYVLTAKLMQHYLENERYTDASQLALAFAQSHPAHPKAKELEVAAIDALEAGGYDAAALQAKQEYVARYGLRGESWYGKEPLQVPEVRERLQQYLDTIVASLHAGAQDTKLPVDYAAAAEWYGKYLEIFPESPRAAELAYLRGDVLFEAKRYADAAHAYERVAYAMAPNERAAEAGYAAVLAWRKAAGEQAAINPQVKAATLKFAETYPAHEQATAVLALLAEELYRGGQVQEAEEIATRLIEHQPAPALVPLTNAWRIRSAAALQAERWAEGEKALAWLLANGQDIKRTELQQQLATAIYRQGEALAAAGDDAAAAKEFLRLRAAVPAGAADTIRATALYDAAAAMVRAGDQARSVALLESFRDEYPQHELVPEATRKLAALHLELGHELAAAREFTRVREQAGISAKTRQDAAAEAARLFAEAGETTAAIAAYEAFLAKHTPGFDPAMEARHALVELYAASGQPSKADAWRQSLIDAFAGAGAARSERSRTLAAQAALKLANDRRQAFAQVNLALPLQETLPAKQERLEAALAGYDRAAEYGVTGVVTAATYYTGDLYYDFGKALLDSPRPPELSGQDLAQYNILLEEQAFPFEEKAIDIHEANVERIPKGVYDEWVQKSLGQLAKLVPARYSKTERLGNGIVTLQ